MNILSLRWGACTLLLGALTVSPVAAQPPAVPPFDRNARPGDPPPVPGPEKRAPGDKEPEILGRGPLHQGFAQPSNTPPRPSPVVPKAPPAPIEEVPPKQRPEGDNVVWVPGYWAWDDDRGDYIWVSGFWRVPPPGREWVPGYWTKVDGGWRFVSGYWADVSRPATPVPEVPPESLDLGPSYPPVDDSYFWVPGNWLWRDRWLWQPGYWCPPRPGWVYTPPSYCWTPAGCLFNGGFWDRCLETRGLPFAPVYFPPGLCATPGFNYTPAFALGVNGLFDCLWARPGWGYYAFGDFYGGRYDRLGYQPWHRWGPRFHDPLFAYYRNAFGAKDPGWARGLASKYEGRLGGRLPPPPRGFNPRELAGRKAGLVQPLASYRNPNLPLVRATAAERERGGTVLSGYRGDPRPRFDARPGANLARPLATTPYTLGTRPDGARPPAGLATRPPTRPGAATRPSDLLTTRPPASNPYTLGTRPGSPLTTRPGVTRPNVLGNRPPAGPLGSSPPLRYTAPGGTLPWSSAPLMTPRSTPMPRFSSPLMTPRSTPMPRFTAPPAGARFNALSPGVRGGMSRPPSFRGPVRGR